MTAKSINRVFFFETCATDLFGGSLSATRKKGLTSLLDYWENNHVSSDDRWLAYILGTAYHEVDKTMKPIHEYGGKSYFMHKYDKSFAPAKAKELGNDVVGDGATYHGRGFVQLTGKRNYKDWKNRLGVDIVADPDKVLDLGVATRIIIEGMILGTFTTKMLSSYFNSTTEDWVRARRTVNGLNKANLIAGHGKGFLKAITYK